MSVTCQRQALEELMGNTQVLDNSALENRKTKGAAGKKEASTLVAEVGTRAR